MRGEDRPIPFHAWAPPVPFVRNYFKNEFLYHKLQTFLVDLAQRHSVDRWADGILAAAK